MSRPAPTASPPPSATYTDIQAGEDFARLRHAHRSFAFPMTLGFCAWYLLYVLLSNYAGDFMSTQVVGHINMAFVLGVLQFATTFAIAWWYARHAGAKLDPQAERIRAEAERRLAAALADERTGEAR
ncbi:DUF485 domain-containing protein [Streptomyces sp. 7N604]|uniref:DUF485 domain-containing protein n=1 Tax=Streptomyces sp. 7N604 TaxID=3457415 RepID=UPI003FD0F619